MKAQQAIAVVKEVTAICAIPTKGTELRSIWRHFLWPASVGVRKPNTGCAGKCGGRFLECDPATTRSGPKQSVAGHCTIAKAPTYDVSIHKPAGENTGALGPGHYPGSHTAPLSSCPAKPALGHLGYCRGIDRAHTPFGKSSILLFKPAPTASRVFLNPPSP
jgi:hypothetical protein